MDVKAKPWTEPRRAGRSIMLVSALIMGIALSSGYGIVQAGNAGSHAHASSSTLVVAMPSDMQNLDPTLSSADIPTQEMLTNVYSWLVDYKIVQQNGQLLGAPNSFIGGVAQSFKKLNGGKTIRFFLRKNAKFANGDPINAAAVKFTYDRVFDQKGVTSSLMAMAGFTNKNAIKVVNNTTVDIHLTKANDLLFGNMGQFGNSILDPKVVKKHETSSDPYAHNWLATHTTGTESGPYELSSWQPGNQWVLTANPNYFGPKPKITKIIFKVIPDPSTRLALLKSGAVDMTYELAPKDVPKLRKDPNVKVKTFPSRFVVFLGMNSKLKPFNNIKVRQAISYAVPYNTIIKQVLYGLGVPLTSPVPFGTPTHTAKFFHYTQNFARAKQLLAQAGYPNGFTTTLTIANDVTEAQETAVWVKEALSNIGITVNIQQMPSAAFTGQLQKHQLGFFFFNNWISINNDPYYHLFWLFNSACCDYTNFHNSTVTNTINKYMLSTNETARNAGSLNMQKIIVSQAPWVFLYQPDFVVAMRKNISGYAYYSSDQFTRYNLLSKG